MGGREGGREGGMDGLTYRQRRGRKLLGEGGTKGEGMVKCEDNASISHADERVC